MDNTEHIIKNFFDFVRVDSVTGKESAFAEYLTSFLIKNKLVHVAKRDKFGNIYARVDGSGNPIFFAAHLDTVSPGEGIKPQENGEYLTSDGTTILGADNKSAIAAFIEALFKIKEGGINHRTIELMFTLSEEVGNYGAINFDYSLLKSKFGYCLDYAQPLGAVVIASPYYERIDITIEGRSAHASRPEEAINVLTILAYILQEVKLGTVDEDTIFNIGVVNCGTVRNAIPGKLQIEAEIRSFTEKSLVENREKVVETVRKITTKLKGNLTIDVVRENPGYKFSEDKKEIKNTFKVMKDIGIIPRVEKSWSISDANIFNDKGLMCLNLSDGVENPHTEKERIKKKNLKLSSELILALMIG